MITRFEGGDVTEILTLLRATGLSASTDAARVETPGVWVRLDNVDTTTLKGGSAVTMTLHPVVQGQNLDEAWEALTVPVNAVLDVLRDYGGPSGPMVPTALQLQPGGTGLPAFAIPFRFKSTPTPEETP